MAPHKNKLVYCKDVAKKLRIKGHKCRQKYFLDSNNCQRYKLRSFCLEVPTKRDYICGAFQLHHFIHRALQVPIEVWIEKMMGGKKIELCDYLRGKINNMLDIGAARSSTESSSGRAENVSDQVSVLTGDDDTRTIQTINTSKRGLF